MATRHRREQRVRVGLMAHPDRIVLLRNGLGCRDGCGNGRRRCGHGDRRNGRLDRQIGRRLLRYGGGEAVLVVLELTDRRQAVERIGGRGRLGCRRLVGDGRSGRYV
jgi:hypothetical protein